MHSFATLVVLLPFLPLIAQAAHNPPSYLRHRRLADSVKQVRDVVVVPKANAAPRANTAHADAHRVIKRIVKKRGTQCRARTSSSSTSVPAPTSSSDAADDYTPSSSADTYTSSVVNVEAYAHQTQSPSTTTSTSSAAWTPASSSSAAAAASSSSAGHSSSSSGLLSFTDSTCGSCDSSSEYPNGSEDWLNCGVTGAGWTPPSVQLSDVIYAELTSDGVFSPCADYIDKFTTYGAQYGIPPIMLASFALQESTCNEYATGPNGEYGLMQIAPINCVNPPNGNCYDVDYNINRAAELFSGMIDSNNGNVIAAAGSYNGWFVGMTYSDATAAASTGSCGAQNNLDYVSQLFNGWMQGRDGTVIGQYFNLAHC